MTSVLKVDNIQNSSGTSALSIDSSGSVSFPNTAVPAFRVGLLAAQVETSTGLKTVHWDETTTHNCFLNGGVTNSSGVITVPKAGIYQVNATMRINAIGSGYIELRIKVNNVNLGNDVTYVLDGSPDSSYDNLTGSDVFKLDANDNIRVQIYSSADTSWNIAANSIFSGTRIG